MNQLYHLNKSSVHWRWCCTSFTLVISCHNPLKLLTIIYCDSTFQFQSKLSQTSKVQYPFTVLFIFPRATLISEVNFTFLYFKLNYKFIVYAHKSFSQRLVLGGKNKKCLHWSRHIFILYCSTLAWCSMLPHIVLACRLSSPFTDLLYTHTLQDFGEVGAIWQVWHGVQSGPVYHRALTQPTMLTHTYRQYRLTI